MEKKLHAVEKNLSLICQHLIIKKYLNTIPDYYFEFDSKLIKIFYLLLAQVK